MSVVTASYLLRRKKWGSVGVGRGEIERWIVNHLVKGNLGD